MKDTPLKIVQSSSTPSMQASKWLQLRMLLGEGEIRSLLEELGQVFVFRIGSIVDLPDLEVSSKSLIDNYLNYLNPLKSGKLPDLQSFKRNFALVLTQDPQALFAYQIEEGRYLLKVAAPIVQIQAHSMHYSLFDHKFRSMTLGADCITWGLQFSYPQIYQDPVTLQIKQADERSDASNGPLFKKILKWQRAATVPTPFLIKGEKDSVKIPMRLGKSCFSWINNHPQFFEKNIKVESL